MFGVEAYPDLEVKAAALLSSLSQNHPLFDGNKRFSWVLTLTFLEMNNVIIDMETELAFDLILRTAQSKAGLDEIAALLRAHRRRTPPTPREIGALTSRGRPWDTGRTMRFIIRVVVNAFALWVVTLIPALQVVITAFPPGETLQLVLTLLAVAAIFALVNTIIGTIVKIVAFPLYIITFGLIGFLINGFLLWLTAWITSGFGWGLTVGDFWWGVLAALIISVINGIFGFILRPQSKNRRD